MSIDPRKLYRIIENLKPNSFRSNEDLLRHLISNIVRIESFGIAGGRLWKLNPSKQSYYLIHQVGDLEQIRNRYALKIRDYPHFRQLGNQRSVLGIETDRYLRKKGIALYSATGVGEKITLQDGMYYEYVMAFNRSDQDRDFLDQLNIISSAATSMLQSRRSEQKQRLLEQDIDQALQIQRSILPAHELNFGGYQAYGVSLPERVVGGDFFDYLTFDDDNDRVGIAIGDATSKGLSAAVHALYIAGALRLGVMYNTKIGTLLHRINALANKSFPDDRFISLFYTEIFNTKSGLVLYANAGHNAPIQYEALTHNTRFLDSTGPLLGLAPTARYGVENINLLVGDILLLYTDGITEARSAADEQYGEERLRERLIELHDLPPRELVASILEDVQIFSANSTYSDDKTLLVIKRVH